MSRWFNRISENVVECVPEEIAACEYDCRAPSCSAGEWKTCERRIDSLQVLSSTERKLNEKLYDQANSDTGLAANWDGDREQHSINPPWLPLLNAMQRDWRDREVLRDRDPDPSIEKQLREIGQWPMRKKG